MATHLSEEIELSAKKGRGKNIPEPAKEEIIMKIIINTETREIKEIWSKEDREIPWSDVQKQKITGIGMALAGQMAAFYTNKTQRDHVLAKIFTAMIGIMDDAEIKN